jgi:hypothetical protein
MYFRCPGHFSIAENGQVSYVPATVKKMTISVLGLIYVEYSDIEDIRPQPATNR